MNRKKISITLGILSLLTTALLYLNFSIKSNRKSQSNIGRVDYFKKRMPVTGKITSKRFDVKARVMCPSMVDDQNRIVRLGSESDLSWRRGCYKHYFEIKAKGYYGPSNSLNAGLVRGQSSNDIVCHSGYTDIYGRIDVKNISCPNHSPFAELKIYIKLYAEGKNHTTCLRRQGARHCDLLKNKIFWLSQTKRKLSNSRRVTFPTFRVGVPGDSKTNRVAAFNSQQISRAFDRSKRYFGLNLGDRKINIELYGGGKNSDGSDQWCWFLAGTNRLTLCNNPSLYWGNARYNPVIHEVGHILHRYVLGRSNFNPSNHYCGSRHSLGLRTDNRKALLEGLAIAFVPLYYYLLEGTTEEIIKFSDSQAPLLSNHKDGCGCGQPSHGFDDEGVVAQFLIHLFFGHDLDWPKDQLRGSLGFNYIGRRAYEKYDRKKYKIPSAFQYFNALKGFRPNSMAQTYSGINNQTGFLNNYCQRVDRYFQRTNQWNKASICKHPNIDKFFRIATAQTRPETWNRYCGPDFKKLIGPNKKQVTKYKVKKINNRIKIIR